MGKPFKAPFNVESFNSPLKSSFNSPLKSSFNSPFKSRKFAGREGEASHKNCCPLSPLPSKSPMVRPKLCRSQKYYRASLSSSPMVKRKVWSATPDVQRRTRASRLARFGSPDVVRKLSMSPSPCQTPATPDDITSNSIQDSPFCSPSWEQVSRMLMMKKPKDQTRNSLLTFPDYDCLMPALTSKDSNNIFSPATPADTEDSLDLHRSFMHVLKIKREPEDLLAQQYKTWVCEDTKTLVNGYGRLEICTEAGENGSLGARAVQAFRVLTANYLFDNNVLFDSTNLSLQNSSNNTVLASSSNGFSVGVHEWSLQILHCGVFRPELGAKIVFGNELGSDSTYYASYNSDGSLRVKKTIEQRRCWAVGDVVRTVLNLKKG